MTKTKVKCPYCGREMKAMKETPLLFSYCEGGLFRKHDIIQWTSIDNTFQTRSGKMARELAKKGYEVRVSTRTVVDKCPFCGTYTLGREVCPGCGGKTTVDTYEIVAKKKG